MKKTHNEAITCRLPSILRGRVTFSVAKDWNPSTPATDYVVSGPFNARFLVRVLEDGYGSVRVVELLPLE